MLRRKGFWVILVIIIIAAGAGGYYYSRSEAVAQAEEEQKVQTSTVRRGSIVISASGSGTVISANEIDLGFESGGSLVEMPVAVGDSVMLGDLLARLEDTQAQENIIAAQLQVLAAQEALSDQNDKTPEELALALAEVELANAQLQLDELLAWEPDEAEVEQAQAAFEAAQASYDSIKFKPVNDQLTSARVALEQAEEALVVAQANYDQAWDSARDWELYMTDSTGTPTNPGPSLKDQLESERSSTESQLAKAYDNLEIAQASYNLTLNDAYDNSAELSAWNQVLNAEANLEDVMNGPEETEIQSAQIQVLQAQISLAEAQKSVAETSESAELTLEQAELNLQSAQDAMEAMSISAPFDGTVMDIGAQVGEKIETETLITLADIEQPSIEVYLDETDLNQVGVGYEVEVVFDALPDDVFNGTVTHVDPALVETGGMMMVRAVVQLDAASYAKPQFVPVGASASVEVIGGKAENALLVPVESLTEYDTDKYAVFVMIDGEPLFTPVEVGLMDYTFAEIVSGLEEGDVVTTGIVETN